MGIVYFRQIMKQNSCSCDHNMLFLHQITKLELMMEDLKQYKINIKIKNQYKDILNDQNIHRHI